MLVAVALVLLMMTLFAQVFQMAGGSVSTQRGLMENDQRARTAQTLLYGDLSKRTFRVAIPFAFNEDLNTAEANLARRRGYFYISENDPANETDDVLAFTCDAAITRESPDVLSYYGRSLLLAPDAQAATPATGRQVQQELFFRANPNQPETDDGRLDGNTSADSQMAEVAYFLRNGNLYRRVLLIRQQNSSTSDDQPRDDTGQRFFQQTYAYSWGGSNFTTQYPSGFNSATSFRPAATCFWGDFDFSAHPVRSTDSMGNPIYNGCEFNGALNTLQIRTEGTALPVIPTEIAYPPNRFGHNTVTNTAPSGATLAYFGGQPREYGTGGWWVGRPTMEETSFPLWTYPHLTHTIPTNTYTDAQNTMNAAFAWNDADSNNVIDNSSINFTGARRGEDLLLPNVHSFDVRVWDEVLEGFVDIGHTLPASGGIFGDYHLANRLNQVYGPNTVAAATAWNGTSNANHVFDTWYPFHAAQQIDLNQDGVRTEEDANNDGVLDMTNDTDVNGNGTLVDHENGPPYRPRKIWASDTTASATGRPLAGRWTATTTYNPGDKVFPTQVRSGATQVQQPGDPFYYVCVKAEDLNSSGAAQSGTSANEPSWPRIDGLNVLDGNGELTWQAVDNRKPLRAIQITLRFLDPSTQQMRTLTIQHSLME